MNIEITPVIYDACPCFAAAYLEGKVQNSGTTDALWNERELEIQQIKRQYSIETVNKRPEIAATRAAYKKLGKDPNRYRPSAEALCRRILRDIPIYRLNTLVDIINIVSIRSGLSIGGFDSSLIQGNIHLVRGNISDDFEAIGRGKLNVDGLPLYKDDIGGIGTPTSDNERTKITGNTTDILLIFNGYTGKSGLNNSVEHAIGLLKKYAGLHDEKITYS